MKRTLLQRTKYLGLALAGFALAVGGGALGARLAGPTPGNGGAVADQPTEPAAMPVAFEEGVSQDVSLAFQNRFRQVARDTMPVVVEINTINTVTRDVPVNPFSFFFGRPDDGSRQREYEQRGLGSGVIVGRDRDTVYVLTNNHVAGEADEIEIVLSDGRTFAGEIVGGDDLLDLAMVSFETEEDVPIARLGDSEALEIGDWVFAVGNPLGFQSTVTAGIVSAKERAVSPNSGLSGVTNYIQTDASINQGNSGGALVNLNGEIVGINTWIASRSGGSDGIGFAIPINMAARAIEDFIERGEVAYSWLGVLTGDPNPALREDLGVDGEGGALVYGVYADSPAQAGGLEPGDVVLSIDGEPIDGSSALVRRIAAYPPRERVAIDVLRDGSRVELTIRTGVRDDDAGGETAELWPGIAIQPLSDELRERLELRRRAEGVLVAAVSDGTPAAGSGLRRGDLITAVNGRSVDSARAFYRELSDVTQRDVQFRVLREGNQIILGFVRPR